MVRGLWVYAVVFWQVSGRGLPLPKRAMKAVMFKKQCSFSCGLFFSLYLILFSVVFILWGGGRGCGGVGIWVGKWVWDGKAKLCMPAQLMKPAAA